MKRLITLILLSVLCLSVLTGCGSSEKEKIWRYLQEEAAEDGVDLQEMLEQEMADSIARTKAAQEKRAEQKQVQQDADEQFDALIELEFDALLAASDYDDTVRHAEAFNDYCAQKRVALGGKAQADTPLEEYGMLRVKEKYYKAKALYVSAGDRGDYANVCRYENRNDPSKVMLLLFNTDEGGNKTECMFVRPDTGTCKLNLRDFLAPENLGSIVSVSDDLVRVSSLSENYLFDITGKTARLLEKQDGYCAQESDYEGHDLMTAHYGPASDADFNDLIIREGVGLNDFTGSTPFGVVFAKDENGHYKRKS